MICRVVRRSAAVVLFVAALAPLSFAQRAASRPAPAPSLAELSTFGPLDAPISIVQFTDLECPFSGNSAPVVRKLLDAYPGQVRLVIKHTPLAIHPNAPLAHMALLAAAQQGKFWPMHDLLFANQKQLTREQFLRYARRLNLDIPRFTRALDSPAAKAFIAQNLAEARAFGVNSTPTFFINGSRHDGFQPLEKLRASVDTWLNEAARLASAPPPPNPNERVTGFELSNVIAKGPENAPVTIVEFTDFECPFCRTAVQPMHQLLEAFPKEVRWIVKQYPLDFHKNAPLAHEAALAAGEQGKFFEMHDLIFANPRALSRDDLIARARQLSLNLDQFVKDLDSHRFAAQIAADRAEGARFDVSGTPMFFINGRRLSGARSFPELKQVVEQELRLANLPAGATSQPVPTPRRETTATVIEGPPQAPVTLTWFADATSTLEPQAAAIVRQLAAEYQGKVRVLFKNLPTERRPQATLAHTALLVAAAEGKFWQMHELLMAHKPGEKERLLDFSDELSLDRKIFAAALEEKRFADAIKLDLAEAQRRDIRGTPVFFINNVRVDGLQPLSLFKTHIDAELRKTSTASN